MSGFRERAIEAYEGSELKEKDDLEATAAKIALLLVLEKLGVDRQNPSVQILPPLAVIDGIAISTHYEEPLIGLPSLHHDEFASIEERVEDRMYDVVFVVRDVCPLCKEIRVSEKISYNDAPAMIGKFLQSVHLCSSSSERKISFLGAMDSAGLTQKEAPNAEGD